MRTKSIYNDQVVMKNRVFFKCGVLKDVHKKTLPLCHGRVFLFSINQLACASKKSEVVNQTERVATVFRHITCNAYSAVVDFILT